MAPLGYQRGCPIAISEFGFEYHHVPPLNLDHLPEFVSSLSGRISTVNKAERGLCHDDKMAAKLRLHKSQPATAPKEFALGPANYVHTTEAAL